MRQALGHVTRQTAQGVTAVISHQAPMQPAPRNTALPNCKPQANRLSNAQQLAALGVERGDRVAVVLPQRFETAVAYMALLANGRGRSCRLSQLFGPEALLFRLQDSASRVGDL